NPVVHSVAGVAPATEYTDTRTASNSAWSFCGAGSPAAATAPCRVTVAARESAVVRSATGAYTTSPGVSASAPVENVTDPPAFSSSSTQPPASTNGAVVFCCTSKVLVPTPGAPSAPPQTHSESFHVAIV